MTPASSIEHPRRRTNQRFLELVLLLGAGALLFALSFPSFLSQWGWFPLAYIATVPAFMLANRARWIEVPFLGFLYGLAAYALNNFWLVGFHPLAVFAVPVIYAVYFMLLLPLLKAARSLSPRYGYLLQIALWLAYEYLRTQGYLGYSYGIMGYTQYLFIPLIGIAELGGVWAVSLLVVAPGAYLAAALCERPIAVWAFLLEHWIAPLIYAAAFAAAITYGVIAQVDYSESPTWRVALIQQNSDPLAEGRRSYWESLERSVRQSELALEQEPDIVIWSETAFVPPIDYHLRYRVIEDSYNLIVRLMDFLDTQDRPYVIGNSSARRLRDHSGDLERVDYNAVIVWNNGEFIGPYRKTHLVPFTEHFPFERQLPWMYNILVNMDTHFWGEGEEYTVFEAAGVTFGTPICFEDTFGYISREFVNRGSQVIVNLTNDLWSKSVVAAMQHMQMATFRAVENRRSLVRATNGGMTVAIDPNGRIQAMIPAFEENHLVADVPVYTEGTTLYRRWGDWLAVVMLILAPGGLIICGIFAIARRQR